MLEWSGLGIGGLKAANPRYQSLFLSENTIKELITTSDTENKGGNSGFTCLKLNLREEEF